MNELLCFLLMLNMDEFVRLKHQKMLSRRKIHTHQMFEYPSFLLFHDVNDQQTRYYELIPDYPLYPQDI